MDGSDTEAMVGTHAGNLLVAAPSGARPSTAPASTEQQSSRDHLSSGDCLSLRQSGTPAQLKQKYAARKPASAPAARWSTPSPDEGNEVGDARREKRERLPQKFGEAGQSNENKSDTPEREGTSMRNKRAEEAGLERDGVGQISSSRHRDSEERAIGRSVDAGGNAADKIWNGHAQGTRWSWLSPH